MSAFHKHQERWGTRNLDLPALWVNFTYHWVQKLPSLFSSLQLCCVKLPFWLRLAVSPRCPRTRQTSGRAGCCHAGGEHRACSQAGHTAGLWVCQPGLGGWEEGSATPSLILTPPSKTHFPWVLYSTASPLNHCVLPRFPPTCTHTWLAWCLLKDKKNCRQMFWGILCMNCHFLSSSIKTQCVAGTEASLFKF